MTPVDRHNERVILFVTVGTRPRVSAFTNEAFAEAFVLACGDADAWSVGKYMIMPDHVHLFCSPAIVPRVGIKQWSGYLKRRTSIRLMNAVEDGPGNGSRGRSPSNGQDLSPGGRASPRAVMSWKWQADCWDTQIRSPEHYHEKWEYVRQNPVRKELVEEADDWPWQGELNVLLW
ncbi:transposase [Verrucomicrobiota bacterium]